MTLIPTLIKKLFSERACVLFFYPLMHSFAHSYPQRRKSRIIGEKEGDRRVIPETVKCLKTFEFQRKSKI